MQQKKTKIILDADVIIHFVKAEAFSLLPDIFPEYEYVILEIHDTKSVVLKKPEDFVNYVLSACNESNLNSVCDFSVNFMDKDHNNYECSILPKNNIPSKITIDNDGLIYKFKFLKNLE